MKNIIQNGDPVLRDMAKKVPIGDIKSPKIKKLLKNMSEALNLQKNGVAIAAPQIGVSLRVFIVSGKLFNPEENTEDFIRPNRVFINPIITKTSKKESAEEEGCLSVHGEYGTVNRPTKTTIRAYNEDGEIFERGGSGLLSKIFQHEMDHLNGVLFVDKADNLYDIKQN
ncbi:MAG: peptide deformylase [Patescibacteria group bacterium]